MKGTFEEMYKGLNPAQKQAVDTVEGPVLVVAGPGTGKTHILTLRMANILRQTQANPSNILALTFTDSAARTMRRRLAAIVGDEVAREVTISTFHGFCELVISRYPERFSGYDSRRLMGDVEQVLLYRDAIEQSESNELRPPKAPYTYLDDLKRLYDTFAREGMSLADYKAWGDDERNRLRNDESLLRKRDGKNGERAGELTKAGEEKLERIDKVDEAASILEKYEALKEERGLYDFTDLLRLVIGKIASDDNLRADLQEQYQYILADEHQDANALQHKLLELFAVKSGSATDSGGDAAGVEIDDFPNIFVVGDEKQAIYRFQGADLTQFRTFTEIFPRATVITLSASFRSYQSVLDIAHGVIESTGTHERLTAERGVGDAADGSAGVSLILGNDPLDERAKICELVAEKVKAGTPPHEIAVISRKNETADLIANQLEALGVPVLRAGDVSLTSRPLVHAILALMHYVADPTRFDSLRRALIAPWWGSVVPEFSIPDILLLLRTSRDTDLLQRLDEKFPELASILKNLIEKSTTQTAIECFSNIFTSCGARDYLLAHADHFDDIILIRHLIMYLEEAAALHVGSNFREAMESFARAGEHEMSPVKTAVTEREGFVTVITAHKAKGMEFKYVFIPEMTENGWEKGGKAAMIPSPFADKQSIEDARRLFYVALTRAKDHAYLSYAFENKDGRERNPSILLPSGLVHEEILSEPLPLLHRTIDAPVLLTEMARHYLTEEGLAPTALNEYLKSPPTFFACRILRMKEPSQGPAILGSAVHGAIAIYLKGDMSSDSIDRAHGAIEKTFRDSLLPRGNIFDDLIREAHALFDAYVAEPLPSGKASHIEKAFRTERVVDGVTVLMQGKIDAVFETSKGTCVIDFKTGSAVSAKNEEYVRQLALYSYLLEQNNEKVSYASLIAISKDGVRELAMKFAGAARETSLAEFDAAVQELLTGKWRVGQPSEYDNLLKLFEEKQ